MAKAASKLGVSTPSISEAIADLEHSLGVRIPDSQIRMDYFRSVRHIADRFAGDADVAA